MKTSRRDNSRNESEIDCGSSSDQGIFAGVQQYRNRVDRQNRKVASDLGLPVENTASYCSHLATPARTVWHAPFGTHRLGNGCELGNTFAESVKHSIHVLSYLSRLLLLSSFRCRGVLSLQLFLGRINSVGVLNGWFGLLSAPSIVELLQFRNTFRFLTCHVRGFAQVIR